MVQQKRGTDDRVANAHLAEAAPVEVQERLLQPKRPAAGAPVRLDRQALPAPRIVLVVSGTQPEPRTGGPTRLARPNRLVAGLRRSRRSDREGEQREKTKREPKHAILQRLGCLPSGAGLRAAAHEGKRLGCGKSSQRSAHPHASSERITAVSGSPSIAVGSSVSTLSKSVIPLRSNM